MHLMAVHDGEGEEVAEQEAERLRRVGLPSDPDDSTECGAGGAGRDQ